MSNRTSKSSLVLLLCLVCAAATCLSPVFAAEDDVLQLAENAFATGSWLIAKPLYLQLYNEYGANNTTPGLRAFNSHVIAQLGRCCTKLGQLGEARDWFEQVIKVFPDDQDACAGAQYDLGRVYTKMGLKDLAKQELEKVVTTYPNERGICAYALLAKAKIDMRPGRYSLAVATLERLIDGYSDKLKLYKDAKRMLVDALDNDLRINDALELLDDTLTADEFDREEKGELMVLKANVQLRASRYADCRATCGRVFTEWVDWKRLANQAKWAMMQVLCEEGSNPDKALELIAEMDTCPMYRDPSQKAQLVLWSGQSYWLKSDYAKAEECFTRLINDAEALPAFAGEGYFHRAKLYATSLKRYEEAALDIARIHYEYLRRYAQGVLHLSRSEYAQAAAEFELVIENLPPQRVANTEPVSAFRRMVSCYVKLGDAAKAQSARDRLAAYEATHK